ncbi:extracellular solute-binding protein [Vibrio cholerae]|uniref:extracellular solute-binding protein n=1 Tax=Vibrio cholerae TaxID=666 RepID=UPI0018F0881B|nr:extracellular solute-binding protein [Vibrio cholerae]MBJ6942839.1 ABC transporter substrate-binding protein [Vibrio cholerae]MCD6702930.1 extracellular solute-binding protein [Vibrio cholerae]HDZ9177765.1 ABC transporter substrate-binding protein [Vibrio cholerae]HDZ9623279.1 ABC transporter substrate-binding protein [Vibrio cholerae]
MKKLFIASAIAATSTSLYAASLPSNLQWQTNWDEPVFASAEAKRGGTYRTHLLSFPQTLRSVGPDSNSGLRGYFLDDVPALVAKHPDTLQWIPQLANEWAFAGDNKTVYFKLNAQAKWSDGEPVTADDFVFMLKFYRSPDIVAPWYNEYYTTVIDDVIKIDEHTFAAVSKVEKNQEDLLYTLGSLVPRPEHFYANPKKDENKDGIDDDFVRRYNFEGEPTTNAYYLDEVKKGKSITFKHVGDDWWGYSNRYYQHRFNVDKIRLTIIRDEDIALKHFEKGSLDAFNMILPALWHEKANGELYEKGYIHKFWGYNQMPQGAGGLWMNVSMSLLGDVNVRKGLTYATDFDGMIEKITRGDYSRKPHAMGFGHGGYDLPNPQPPRFEPEKAIKYFEAAGFNKIGPDGIRVNAKGERLSFAITYGVSSWTPRIAYLKEQAKQAGLEFTLNLVDGSSAFKYILEKKHELAFVNMGTSDVPAYWEYFHSVNANKAQTNNHTNYSSPELDTLIEKYKNEFDIEKKMNFSHQIQKLIADADVIVPGYMVTYAREAHWRWIKFPNDPMTKRTQALFPVDREIGLHTFWIDPEVKQETEKAMKSGKAFEPVTVLDLKYKL